MITAKCIKPSKTDCGTWLSHDLEVGKEYEVERIDMGGSYTDVILSRRPKLSYNSVYLEFYEDGKPLDIYKDKRFNRYLK